MPEDIIFIAAVVVVSACVLPFIYCRAARRHALEKDAIPIFEARAMWRHGPGGTFIGGNIPAFRIAAYDDFVVFSGFTHQIVRYHQIKEVRREWLGATAIHYVEEGESRVIRVSCRSNSELLDLLQQRIVNQRSHERAG